MAVVVYLKSLDITSSETGPIILADSLEKDRLIKGNLVLTGIVGVQEANYPSLSISRISLPSHRIRYYVEGKEVKKEKQQIDDIKASTEKEVSVAASTTETPKKATKTRKRSTNSRIVKNREVRNGKK